jgi:hypothetical protein
MDQAQGFRSASTLVAFRMKRRASLAFDFGAFGIKSRALLGFDLGCFWD